MAPGKFPFQTRQEGGRPQDVALGAALEDQDFRPAGEGFKMRTFFATTFETARLVPAEVNAIIFNGVGHKTIPHSLYATI
jgi:hypothetical protein